MDESNENSSVQQGASSDPSASQSGKRRVADFGEIEELQWEAERRRRKRRRSLIIVWGLLGLAVVVAIYTVAARSLVVNARQRYREVYRGMDLSMYRAYNPSGLRKAEQMYRETETMNPYLQTPAILSAADEALQTLRTNYERAQKKESSFEKLRETYNVRRKEARNVGLPELLPEQWVRLRKLEKSFRSDLSPERFDYNQAKEDVTEAIAILNSLRSQYGDLREYKRVRDLQQKTVEAMNSAEWRINQPKVHARLESLHERAETYAKNQEWGAAAQALQQFRQIHEDHWRDVAELRSQAEEEMAKAQSALTGDKAEAVEKVAEHQFAELSEKRQRMQQAFLEYRYEKVEELAEKILAQMQTMKEEVETLKSSRESLMTEFRSLWDQVDDNDVVFRRNWPERWGKIRNLERRIRTLEPEDGRQLDLIKTLQKTIEKLKALVKLAREQAQEASARRKKFLSLEEDTNMDLLEENLPETYETIRRLRLRGRGAWEGQMYSQAAEAYAEARKILQEAQAELGERREHAEALRGSIIEQLETYTRGLEVFVPRVLEEARERRQNALEALDNQRFDQAIAELEAMEALMPEDRWAAQENGTLLDFVTGLMWGTAPEAGAPAKNWYDALTFADELVFARSTRWKLPTREELLTLQDLSAEQRAQFFPTLSEDATVWTSENVTQGGTTAYAVNVPGFEILEASKTQQNLVLPVRTPE